MIQQFYFWVFIKKKKKSKRCMNPCIHRGVIYNSKDVEIT